MRISPEGKIGIGLTLVGLAGAGAIVVAPAPWAAAIGWGMIALAGLGSILLAGHHFGQHSKRRMIPLIGLVASGGAFLFFVAWNFWPTKENLPLPPPSVMAVMPMPVGSLAFVIFTADVHKKIGQNLADVQMIVEVKNSNNFLLKFHAKLTGTVNGKETDPKAIEFDGFAYPNQSAFLRSPRIFGVPFKINIDGRTPAMTGYLDYDVTYREAATEQGQARRTARRVSFDLWSNPGDKAPGTQMRLETIVAISNETEE